MGYRLPFVVARAFDESGRNKADAALIAAAPELLTEALDEIDRLRNQLDVAAKEVIAAAEAAVRRGP
jgi:hypothetical protein